MFPCTIEEVVEQLQSELRKRGSPLISKTKYSNGYLLICCPYHKNGLENNPSAQFREDDGLFYCHACKETHSLPDVITHCLHENGWNWLRSTFLNYEVEERDLGLDLDRKPKKVVEKPQFVPKEELNKYRFIHPYITNRGISKEIIRKFDVGYDPSKDCITFPNKDINGNIVFIATRSVSQKVFRYPYGVKKPIYGLYEIEREKKKGITINEIYIVESMIDALSIWSWGKYAVALNGTGAKHQYLDLNSYPCREYILATDNDEAGKEARDNLRKNLSHKIISELSYKSYGECKDINDMTEEQFKNAEILYLT